MISQILQELMSIFSHRREMALQPVRVIPAFGLLMVASSAAWGQGSMSEGPPGGQGFHQVERPYNVEHGFWQDHASTAAEGYLRGASAVIQAVGVARVHHAQAMILEEQAEWAAYENVKKRINTFNERRRMYRDRVAEDREYARLRDEEGKQLLEQRRATEYRTAYKLTPGQFNPTTGEIYWPQALQSEMFAKQCETLDRLFAQRSKYNLESDHAIVRQIEQVQAELKLSLRSHREMIPHRDYLAAQTFLRGLVYEVKYS
jgi:hypothetical protein